MAIDTRSKRASSVGILLGFALLHPPLPDGTIDQGDRQHIAWSYSGILATAPVVPTAPVTDGYVLTKDSTVTQGCEWRHALPSVITFNGASLSFTPALAEEEFPGGATSYRVPVVLTGAVTFRLSVNVENAGTLTVTAAAQYSLDSGGTWAALDGGAGSPAALAVGLSVPAWSDVAAAAQTDAWLRIATTGGDGGTPFIVGLVQLEVRMA